MLCAAMLSLPWPAAAQRTTNSEAIGMMTGDLVIRVRSWAGEPLSAPAVVTLASSQGNLRIIAPARDDARAVFPNLHLGTYIVEVTAPGYRLTREEAVLDGPGSTDVIILMRPESAGNSAASSPSPPVLAPKVQKEVEKGLAALRENRLGDAEASLRRVVKKAPANSYVHYLLGVLYRRMNDPAHARKEFETSTSLEPRDGRASIALGDLLLRQGDSPGAIRALEQGLAAGAGTWETHWTLAGAYYNEGQYEKALAIAEKALALSKGQGTEIELLVAQALMALGRKTEAAAALDKLLAENPSQPRAEMARRWLEQLRNAAIQPGRATPGPPLGDPAKTPAPRVDIPARTGAPVDGVAAITLAEGRWAPPDIDKVVPATSGDVPCSLSGVLGTAGRRVAQLVENIQSFTATERIEMADLDETGNRRRRQLHKFSYLAAIRELRPGILSIEEDRISTAGLEKPSGQLKAEGLAALALIFHPYYSSDFEMHCEGLGAWRGQPTWLVYFRQRADRPSRIRSYSTRRGRFDVPLKGRAWIHAGNHQIVRLETELVRAMPEFRLDREHLIIEYGAVSFVQRKVKLWLPTDAEMYVRFAGKRSYFRHSFSDFLLFSVDTNSKVEAPKEP